jgi:phage tail protein X
MRYRTRQGDVLDAVCKAVYGRESAAADVLAANPGLADLGPVYQNGLVIDLPELPSPVSQPTIVRLWD